MAEFIDHSPEIRRKMEDNIQAALEACGIQATSHVVNNLTKDAYQHSVSWYKRTGHLKDFSHKVNMGDKEVAIGTNTSYAKYWEYGTGQYAEKGGRSGYWVFVPGSGGGEVGGNTGKVYTEAQAKQVMAILQSKGIDAHMTKGIKPVHMLKNAIEKHAKEYVQIIKQYLGRT